MHTLLILQDLSQNDYCALINKLQIILFLWAMVTIGIGLDLLSGLRKAKLRGERRTSYGLRQTVDKAISYFAFLAFAFMFDAIGSFFYLLPYVSMIVAAFLIFIEMKSIIENADEKEKNRLRSGVSEIAHLLENKNDIKKFLEKYLNESQEITEAKEPNNLSEKENPDAGTANIKNSDSNYSDEL